MTLPFEYQNASLEFERFKGGDVWFDPGMNEGKEQKNARISMSYKVLKGIRKNVWFDPVVAH
jgi:hypothetical protein